MIEGIVLNISQTQNMDYTLFQMRSVFGGRVLSIDMANAAGRAAVEQLLGGGTCLAPDKNWSPRKSDHICNRVWTIIELLLFSFCMIIEYIKQNVIIDQFGNNYKN